MNSKITFLLFSSLFFTVQIETKEEKAPPLYWEKDHYQDYLYKNLWSFSKGLYSITYTVAQTSNGDVTMHRAATLEDIAKKLNLSILIITRLMKKWNLDIPNG